MFFSVHIKKTENVVLTGQKPCPFFYLKNLHAHILKKLYPEQSKHISNNYPHVNVGFFMNPIGVPCWRGALRRSERPHQPPHCCWLSLKEIGVLFHRHLLTYHIIFELVLYVLCYYSLVFANCTHIVPFAPEMTIPIFVF